MKKIVIKYRNDTGDIVSHGLYPVECEVACDIGESTMELDFPVNVDRHFVKDGVLMQRLPRPSDEYDWDGFGWVKNARICDRNARIERHERLSGCDWTQLPDVPLETRQAWMTYRQALRDITSQAGYPTDIDWPEPPQ